MSWFVDTELLVLEVKSHPCLYAKGMAEYSNKIMKYNAWEEITKKLSEDWDVLTKLEKNSRCKDLQLKWKHVRDNFRREYQVQRDVASGQGERKKKKYRYYDELLFLVPYVQDAKTHSNYSAPTNTKRKRKPTSSFQYEVLKANERDDTDEDRAFCLSLVTSLKKMDDDSKMLLKIEMLKLIHKFSNRSHNTIGTETTDSK